MIINHKVMRPNFSGAEIRLKKSNFFVKEK
jgi:hypothetical protein